jgi:hypothetical protein
MGPPRDYVSSTEQNQNGASPLQFREEGVWLKIYRELL